MIYFKPLETDVEWAWARMKTLAIACQDTQGIVAYDDDKIIAVALFDSFSVDGCCVHWAIDNPFVIRRGFLHEIARHLFIQCGRDRLFGMVPADNERALKLDKHIGMVEVSRIPNGYATGIDYIVLCMEKTNCKWLRSPVEEKAA